MYMYLKIFLCIVFYLFICYEYVCEYVRMKYNLGVYMYIVYE